MMRPSSLEQESADQDATLAKFVTQHARPLTAGDLSGYDPLFNMIGKARIVMIGDASHGTHEFYRERALITKRLIEERGYTVVGLEVAKWPDVLPLNRYVQGGTGTAQAALGALGIWSSWLWGNRDMQHFLAWLRRHNDSLPSGQQKVSFFGMDVVNGFPAVDQVLQYLDGVNPLLAQRARERYSCLDTVGGAPAASGHGGGTGLADTCEDQAAEVLQDLQDERDNLLRVGDQAGYFNALMTALTVRAVARFHRAIGVDRESASNLRTTHMQDTIDAVLDHGEGAKTVVWAHTGHVGDARYTENAGQVNIGQLTRQRHPGEMVSVGFGQYEGSVTAARSWGGSPEYLDVPPAIPSSYDNVFHQTGLHRFLLLLRPLRGSMQAHPFDEWRGQRWIGVIYQPEVEAGRYLPTKLVDRYDAFIHIDRTTAVKPLDMAAADPESVRKWEAQTYPEGY